MRNALGLSLAALLATAASCTHAAPAAPAAPALAAPSPAGAALVAVELVATAEECTGLGGQHAALAIDGQRDRRVFYVHAGGHGRTLGAAASPGWYVAELRLFGELRGQPPGLCLELLPASAGEVVRLWRAGGEAEARAVVTSGAPARAPDYAAPATRP